MWCIKWISPNERRCLEFCVCIKAEGHSHIIQITMDNDHLWEVWKMVHIDRLSHVWLFDSEIYTYLAVVSNLCRPLPVCNAYPSLSTSVDESRSDDLQSIHSKEIPLSIDSQWRAKFSRSEQIIGHAKLNTGIVWGKFQEIPRSWIKRSEELNQGIRGRISPVLRT